MLVSASLVARHASQRIAGVPESDHPAVSPFARESTRGLNDKYVLAVQSKPLFKDLPKQGSTTTLKISRRDIGSEWFFFDLPPFADPVCDQNRACY